MCYLLLLLLLCVCRGSLTVALVDYVSFVM
jgi:hypothetical protein